MSEWKEVKLGDVCEFNPDNLNKRNYPYKNILYLDTSSVTKNVFSNYQEFDIKLAPSRAKRLVKDKDIIFSSVRPNQQHYGFIKNPQDNLVISTGFIVVRTLNQVPKFIYYYLIQQQIINKLQQIAEQRVSTYPSITYEDIANLKIKLPPLPIQKKIADILSVIDEKIETLQNINSTLEEMAKAIFKSWFVDFDIVKAKASGKSDSEIAKEFGISEEIVKLFPSEFVKSEIGKIPKGWEVKKLGDFFPVITGKKNANIASENGKYNFFTCSQDILKSNTYSFNDSAILLAGNGDFNVKWFRGKFEAYQRTYVLIPYEKINLGYLFFAMKHFLNLITSGSQGSVIKFITKGMIENFKIVYPNNNEFINFFNQILDNIETNTHQIQTIQELRDTLLPKLINGEIEVDDLDIKKGLE